MSLVLYNGTTSPNIPFPLYGADNKHAYIRFDNNTPNHLSINLGGKIVDVGEFYSQDVEIPKWFQGNITVTPSAVITSISHGQANNLIVTALYAQEVQRPVSQAIPQQAVTMTATGKPIFTATFTLAGSLTGGQHMEVFNPVNSGVIAEFHYAAVFTTDTNNPTANLIYETVDLNFANVVPIVSHSGMVNQPISVMHATAADISGTFFVANQTVETINVPANLTQNMPIFPDNSKLPPGQGFVLELSGTAQTKTIRLTMKWTEDTIVPPILVTGATAVANSLKNDNQPVGTSLIEATPSGVPQTFNIFNDGSGSQSVIQGVTAHQIFKFNNGGNPLQLGQVGDIVEALGQLLIDQLLTVAAGIKATGATSPAIDLSAITGAVALRLLVGTLTRINVFTGSATSSGTLQAHGLGVKPDGVWLMETSTGTDTNNFTYDPAGSDATNIHVFSTNATSRGYIALAIKV